MNYSVVGLQIVLLSVCTWEEGEGEGGDVGGKSGSMYNDSAVPPQNFYIRERQSPTLTLFRSIHIHCCCMCTVIGVAYMVYIQLQPTNLEL